MANKHYPQQFKVDAVALDRSRPGSTIADDVGVNRETLRSWVRIDDQQRGPAAGSATPPAVAGSVEDENIVTDRAALTATPRPAWSPFNPCPNSPSPVTLTAGIVSPSPRPECRHRHRLSSVTGTTQRSPQVRGRSGEAHRLP